MQLKLAGKLKGVRGIVFGEMRDCRQTANQGYTLQDVVLRIVGGSGSSRCLRSAFRPRDRRQYHAADRRSSRSDGARRSGKFKDSGSSGDSLGREKLIAKKKYERKEAYSPDRHLRHSDGVAGRNAEAARIPRDRFGCRRLSPDVRFSGASSEFPWPSRSTPGISSLRPIWWSSAMRFRAAMLNWSTSSIGAFHFARCPNYCTTNFCAERKFWWSPGTHGKTTTTSMLAWIFHTAGMQPSFLIGGIAENFGSSFHRGAGEALHPGRRRVRHRLLR